MTDTATINDILRFLEAARLPLIAIVGPTAGGKTAFSIELAHALRGEGMTPEILNADSRQVYRAMDIGTAKISREEMQDVPHHLLNLLDPDEELTAAWYRDRAAEVIADIHARSGVPVLVGGSMLYVSAVTDGLQFVPAADPGVRERLSREYDADGGAALYTQLLEADPETAAAFDRANKPYVLRALEIMETTGEKPSIARRTSDVPYDLLMLGVERPRDELQRRITSRVPELLKRGWIDEVRALRDAGYSTKDPGMKSHGYREILEYLERGGDEAALAETIAAKSRQYAKRQLTWWRPDPRIRWITPD